MILPGTYSDADLDGDADQPVDHTVRIIAGKVHGETGDRPMINLVSDLGFGAFVVHAGTTLSDVEVDAPNSSGVISMTGGVVERIIARTNRDGSVPCEVDVDSVGLLRDSFCFSGGEDSSAVSAEIFNKLGTHTVRLRNVTAVATKPDSDGLFFEGRGAGTTINVDAKSVIARARRSGTADDAAGWRLESVVRAGHLAVVERLVEDLLVDPQLLRHLANRAI